MKKEVNPAIMIGAIVVVLLVAGVFWWKGLAKESSGPNPYTAANAPKGMEPGKPMAPTYIRARTAGYPMPGAGGRPVSGGGQ